MKPYFVDEQAGITIYHANCLDLLPALCEAGFDAAITDPQYGIGENYASGHDSADDVTLALSVLALLRFSTKRIALTSGIRHLFRYPQPDWIGSFSYPAGSGVNPWGFTCWQPILFYGTDPYAGKGSRPDSYTATTAAEKNGHPCPKPIDQWKWLINRASLEGELIVDPFLGSGTTARACKDLNRRCIGIEIEERYCEISAKRLSQGVLQF